MTKVSFDPAFQRSFRKRAKRNSRLKLKFSEKLEQFIRDPFHPSLKTHKLSGKLQDLWSFSLDYDARVLFYFVEDNKAIFVDIGNHDQVY